MAKEGLFNVVENYLEWADVRALDLFSGTGNICYEMASRGCPDVTAVDSFRDCLKFIDKTAEQLGYLGIKTVLSDVPRYLQRNPQRWDFIFADPPYDYGDYPALIGLALEKLPADGLFVLEHGAEHDFIEHPACFDTRRYGSVHFSYFSLEALSDSNSEG